MASVPTPDIRGGQSFDEATLTQDLLRLGVKTGARLIVHSSLSRVGWINDGPEALISALKKVIGQDGLLMMPTFNHGAPFSNGGSGIFDPAETPSLSGLLSETFRTQKDVFRSLSPTHSFAAWGHGAREIVAGHESAKTVGEHSPLGRLTRDGGHLLHLGTGHEVSTVKHLAETLHGAHCLSAPVDRFPVRVPGGSVVHLPTWRYRSMPCPLTESGTHLARLMAPIERRGTVGRGEASWSRLDQAVAEIRSLLTHGSSDVPACADCEIGPSSRAEGDWR